MTGFVRKNQKIPCILYIHVDKLFILSLSKD